MKSVTPHGITGLERVKAALMQPLLNSSLLQITQTFNSSTKDLTL
jgi:hypothetical protein